MKTITEFNGFQIKTGLEKLGASGGGRKSGGGPRIVPRAAVAPAEAAPLPAPEATSEPASESPVETSLAESASESESVSQGDAPAEAAAETPVAPEAAAEAPAPSAEEAAAAAVGEALKMEGDKLKHFMAALNLVRAKPHGVKRVVVMTIAETEKAPSGSKKDGEHFYLAEYYPQPAGQQPRGKGRGDRDDKRGGGRDGKRKGRGGGGRGGDRDRGGDRPRGPRPEGAPFQASGGPGREGGTTEGGGGDRRPRRQNRAPRPIPVTKVPPVPGGATGKIIIKPLQASSAPADSAQASGEKASSSSS